jgi:hypothetical protein
LWAPPAPSSGSVVDVYVRDLNAPAAQRITAGTTTRGIACEGVDISDDGRFVAFNSEDPTLTPDDASSDYDAFVRDRANNTTTLVSSTTDYDHLNAAGSALTDDGRYLAARGFALTVDDVNETWDVYLMFTRIPKVTGISPSTLTRGTSTPVTITGQGFDSPPVLNTGFSGVSFTNIVRVNDSTITANATLASNGDTGTKWIAVTNIGNAWKTDAGAMVMCPGCLTVYAAA